MRKLELKIDGMHCKSCAAFINMLFEDTNGVLIKSVDYQAGIAALEFDESKISADKIVSAVNATHYKVTEALEH